MIDFRLYLVTDHRALKAGSVESAVHEACRAGARAVQLREKQLDASSLHRLAEGLRRITASRDARLFVNDRADIARIVRADGVHCPENGFSPSIARRVVGDHALVGVSAHSLETALEAGRAGADFITFGPVFETPSKIEYGPPQGLERLREVASAARLPIFAIGGVTPERAALCLACGAWGVAVVSAVFASADIAGSVREFERVLGRL